jgi:flagellar biosynthesis protein FlhG
MLLRELRRLPAEYVLLDLSAGTSFNTLDLFSISRSGIVVTTPEHPAVLSMLVFLKNLVLRALDLELRRDPALMDLLNGIAVQRVGDAVFSMEAFASQLQKVSPEAFITVQQLRRRIRPRIAYNMIERREDLDILANVDRTVKEILGIECDHFALIPEDSLVRRSLREPRGLLLGQVSPQTRDAFDRLAQRIVKYWDEPVPGSAALLTRSWPR